VAVVILTNINNDIYQQLFACGGNGMKRSRLIQIFSVIMSILVVIGILTISKESVLAVSDSTTGSFTTSGTTKLK
jgi:hypothetical protein